MQVLHILFLKKYQMDLHFFQTSQDVHYRGSESVFVFISVVLRHYFPPQAKMADFISHTVQHPTEGKKQCRNETVFNCINSRNVG